MGVGGWCEVQNSRYLELERQLATQRTVEQCSCVFVVVLNNEII